MSNITWIKVMQLKRYHGPEWLKQVWLGCIFPCEQQNQLTAFRANGILPVDYSQEPPQDPPEEIDGYCFRHSAALAILWRKCPAAACWYREMCYPQPNGYFMLRQHDVEVVESPIPAVQTLR